MSALVERLSNAVARNESRSARLGPIGIHFAEDQAHAVQISRSKSGSYIVRAWASATYPDGRDKALQNPRELKVLLDELVGSRRFSGRDVVIAMPSELLRITSVTYKVANDSSDAQAILKLMDQRLERPIGEYVVDYLPVRGSETDKERVALVMTSLRTDVMQLLDGINNAGMQVTEVDASPAALNRLVSQLSSSGQPLNNVLLINYGARQTYLTLISGRRLLMDKVIDFGANVLLERIARDLNISSEMAEEIALREGVNQQVSRQFGKPDAAAMADLNPIVEIVRPAFSQLVEEVRRASLYAAAESQGESVEQIYTFGAIARWPGADEILSQLSHIPVATSLPIGAIFATDDDLSAGYTGIGPDLAVATGLALRGLVDDS